MESALNILQKHSLRQTFVREGVISLFIQQGVALSEPEIEKSLSGECDRVTIYRTLNTFLEKGIIHKVLDDTGAMKYALCRSGCGASHYHQHNHIHFKCEVCGQTQCLDHIRFESPALPDGFEAKETNVLIQGTCRSCAKA